MKTYIYRLEVIDTRNGHNYIIKKFYGNDTATLTERFEKWFIKSNFEGNRNDIDLFFNEVQHANY